MAQTTRQRQMRNQIVRVTLPRTVWNFLKKNEDYGDGSDEFGLKAQVIDLSRKMKKIKAALWDGKELKHESVEEVAMDMVGHLLLLLEQLERQNQAQTDVTITGYVTEFTAEDFLEAYGYGQQVLADKRAALDG